MVWFNVILIIILLICVITDLKSRKIYNKVIFPGFLIAFSSHLLIGGWEALASSLIGFAIGLSLLLIPYLMGGMGAGDIKLLALIGALKGSVFVLNTAIYMALLGGIIALVILLSRKDVRERFKYALNYFILRRYGIKLTKPDQKGYLSATYPYGIPIAGGAILTLFLGGGFL